jgi:hypothetical protein
MIVTVDHPRVLPHPPTEAAPTAVIASIVGTPTTGIEPHVLIGRHFDDRTPAPARCPARAITASVPSIASMATTAVDFTAIVRRCQSRDPSAMR